MYIVIFIELSYCKRFDKLQMFLIFFFWKKKSNKLFFFFFFLLQILIIGEAGIVHLPATDSNNLSISGAQVVNGYDQNLYCEFLISSINVINNPQGCGRLTINLSKRILKEKNQTQKETN